MKKAEKLQGQFGYGDRVEITTKDKTYTGSLLKRPDLLEGDFTVLKLDSGYNIGIEKSRITGMKLLERRDVEKKQHVLQGKNKRLPTVTIISTGGTISSKVDYATGGVTADYTAEDFVEMIPQLGDKANIRTKKAISILSEDMTPKEWAVIAKAAAEELNNKEVDGVVITHGTDTMHYTAAALSFYLQNLNKPVIITGSQRSIDRGSSDAFMNLSCAITAAAELDGAVVALCMHGSSSDAYCLLTQGTRVRKMHASRRDAFRPVNAMPLAKVYEDGKIEMLSAVQKRKEGNVVVDAHHENVAFIQAYPGMDPDLIEYHLKKGCKGIVLNATGMGNVPTVGEQSILKGIEKAKEKNIPIVITTQTIYGAVHPLVYAAMRKLSIANNCIYGGDMLAEVAYVKLGWVLSKTKDLEKVRELMLKPVAGEISVKSDNNTFLI